MKAMSMRRLTILLLLVAVAACFVPALDPRPWLQVAARIVSCAAFAGALLAFLNGLPRRSDDQPLPQRARGAS